MRKFTGMCISGPRAGEFVACESDTYRVAIYRPVGSIQEGTSDVATLDRIETFDYSHKFLLHLGDDDGIDAWVPRGWTHRQAIEEVFRHYRNYPPQAATP